MFSRLQQAAAALSFGLVAALAAALVAHFAIDALGDVALAHDAYDGLAHDSRGLVGLGLLLAALVLAGRFVIAAIQVAARRDRSGGQIALPRAALFVAGVAAAAVAILVGMESLDSLVATGSPSTLGDALGGSVTLGLGLVAAVAGSFGACAFAALKWFAGNCDELLRAIGAAFAVGLVPARTGHYAFPREIACHARTTAVIRCAAKRGPPAFLFA